MRRVFRGGGGLGGLETPNRSNTSPKRFEHFKSPILCQLVNMPTASLHDFSLIVAGLIEGIRAPVCPLPLVFAKCKSKPRSRISHNRAGLAAWQARTKACFIMYCLVF